MKKFRFKGEVWLWPGIGGWHFVNLPKDLSSKIKKSGKMYGAGFIKIRATLGKSSWTTALFPHKKSETYLLSIKKSIRNKENIYKGDTVDIKIETL